MDYLIVTWDKTGFHWRMTLSPSEARSAVLGEYGAVYRREHGRHAVKIR